MPKDESIKKVLIIGSGPIVIGQACEFDYSGTQSCRALLKEGIEVVLVNSNPATIMTDPQFANKTYIEPISVEFIEKIIAKEKPTHLLPTLGGQTALNAAVGLYEAGILEKHNVKLIGANVESIKKAEDRELFKKAMNKIGLKTPKSAVVRSLEEANLAVSEIGFPVIIRPSFTLGGTGAGIAYNKDEFEAVVKWGLDQSPIKEILVEQSVIGWKEFELEVMRDKADNVVIVCSIENFDPMGVHTGDSITVAPAQTLTDKEYQLLRDASIAIIREIGVETGGSNIQFCVNPQNGEFYVIEMNPRVSRSSALASKATGFPIAKIATLLSIGYTLDEIPNDITKKTPASFEPTLDYVVTKIPRFTFEKFNTKDEIGMQMKSVGEVMAIGRTFKESLQKAIRSLELDYYGFEDPQENDIVKIIDKIVHPNSKRLFYIAKAMRMGMSIDEIYKYSFIDKWFLANIKQILDMENEIKLNGVNIENIKKIKQYGFSDKYIANLINKKEEDIRTLRKSLNIKNVYKMVDTCAAEFESYTSYLYSTYEEENESKRSNKKKVVILGSGPNRIGQGIEFDYTCVHASITLKEEGYESIMINCNPETVSTDYDISDKLYFEPLTFEDVMNVIENENPEGVILQFGGQTPLKLASELQKNNVKILGTDSSSIDIAEDRELFKQLINKLGLKQPKSATATTIQQAIEIANTIGYPVLVRPSYVLGGRAMMIVYDQSHMEKYSQEAIKVSGDHPILIDKFLEDAIEIDVDALSDGTDTVICGIMEHIEAAGVHSGDSACSLPPRTLNSQIIDELKRQTKIISKELKIIGFINIQFAIKDNTIYILEVNPRASRTIPFVSKATGVAWPKIATKVLLGKTLKELNVKEVVPKYYAVKEVVLPFAKFPDVDVVLGPEMKSTGEVMGIDKNFSLAYYKAFYASGSVLPTKGNVFLSLADKDKAYVNEIAQKLVSLGFKIFATQRTYNMIKNLENVYYVKKVSEGRPNILDLIINDEIDFVINTPSGKVSFSDSFHIRRLSLLKNIPYCTTVWGALTSIEAITAKIQSQTIDVKAIQDYYKEIEYEQ
ncbi:MAG: carbamoyl-phosphate synthase large subunit [Desulfurella sp.]|uniref:Carbamoyl phosphate synthase large chain n=2 Tax=Desulfurella TaxID=33001 RepID=A0A1G6LQ35_9BACT|nr:carbamoyl-phosphate synthase large subunit [Desulfurella multipotens]PMP65237.1 MAG: carbamoyl-phosphate synthase large subunit [Desulfurella multipotens]SDC44796.1 carbamoyl-phosphate synthase large subunit [Desulfurella multipotens]